MDVTKSRTAAFIDMDYTLYKKFLWEALFAHHKQNRFNRSAMYAFIAYQYPLWILTRIRLLSREYFTHQNAAKLAWLMKGVSIDRAEKVCEWVIDNEIIPNLRPEMVEVIHDHGRKGHRIFLISGSFTPLLNMLAYRLGIEGSIATPLATKNGFYTGKIIPPLNIGQGKVTRLKLFLDLEGKDIDLTKSYFYTDSFVDIPVMEIFGHPIAVYPDPELEQLAGNRSWPVIRGYPENVQ